MAVLTASSSNEMLATIIPKGIIKTFGEFGVPYVVLDHATQAPDGEIWVDIELLQSGEIDQYPLSQILNDPEAV